MIKLMRVLLSSLAFAITIAATAPAQSLGIQLTNGIDGGVDLPADPRIVPESGITVEAWITYDDASIPTGVYRWPTIGRQNLAGNSEVWNFRVNASNNGARSLAFIVRAGGGLSTVSYSFQPGELLPFTHVAGTFDGQVLMLYKNGAVVGTTTLPAAYPLVFTNGVTRIGNGDAVNPGLESWNGIIDEFRIWPMARTAAEIQSTMYQSLGGLPGGALSFPLDGHLVETSTGIQGTQFGTMAFVPGEPGIQAAGTNHVNVGASTTACAVPIHSLIGSLPLVGNTDFAVWCVQGPMPGSSPFGIVVAATALAPASQPPFAGVDLAFDASTVAALTSVPAASPLGNTRFGLPIPNAANLSGVSLIFQFGFFDPICGPQGVSASSGLSFTLL